MSSLYAVSGVSLMLLCCVVDASLQYGWGNFAPGIAYGDSGMYACGHHLLLAHGKTFDLYHNQPPGARCKTLNPDCQARSA